MAAPIRTSTGTPRTVRAGSSKDPLPGSTRSARAARTIVGMSSSIERVFVAGAGLMGHGIAQVHAAIGKSVVLYEPELGRAEAARTRIEGNLGRSVAKGRLTAEAAGETLERIEATDRLDRVRDADLVIEAVFEDLKVKHDLWREVDRLAGPDAILASNTSSIAIHRLAEAVGGPRRG